VDGKRYQVEGVSWFDRQWGQMAPSFWEHMQWSWMGISLDNGDRISLWDIIDGDKEHAFATLLHPDGRHEIVDVEPLAQGRHEHLDKRCVRPSLSNPLGGLHPDTEGTPARRALGPGAGNGVSDRHT
ncbi:MAG: hypothetical protein QOJ42_4529, partial [Acidobacteriaceae bacterium]|nr:hypothetical protein [Acidobacteriaceae bacterium]